MVATHVRCTLLRVGIDGSSQHNVEGIQYDRSVALGTRLDEQLWSAVLPREQGRC